MRSDERRFDAKLAGRLALSLIFAAVGAYALWEAYVRDWRLEAWLLPVIGAVPLLILSLMQLGMDLWAPARRGSRVMDFQFAEGVEPDVARRRTFTIFGWLFGFVLALWLIGFTVTLPLMIFLYLKVNRESWLLSILMAAAGFAFYWAVFVWLLRLPFPDPVIPFFRMFSF